MIDKQREDTKIEYDDTERSQLFHVEVAVSSAWLIAFFALTMGCKNGRGGSQRSQAGRQLKQILQFCNVSVCHALVVDPGLLHACNLPWMKNGWCKCCFESSSRLVQLFG